MSGINKVILVGNLGKDPEVRHLDGGVTVAKFPLATSETYKKADGTRVENTEWHNVVMWRGLAESAEKYLRKGSLVYIEGKIKTRNWEDNGVRKYFTEVVADVMTMLGRRPDDATKDAVSNEYARSESQKQTPPPSDSTDDLPF
jgi:single-strand DNA-binding protein